MHFESARPHSSEQFEKILKKEFAKEGKELRKDTLNELKKHQQGKWILEEAVVVRVRGNMKRGFISLRQGLSGSKVNQEPNPGYYGYLIEHGQKKGRKPRPFMEPVRERYIDSGRGEAAIQKAIDDLIEKFNAGN